MGALLTLCLVLSLSGCSVGDWNHTGDHTDKNNYALAIDPQAPMVTVHHSIHFTAHSPWGDGAAWSVSPASVGTIDTNGVFAASDHLGTGTIIAMWKGDVRYTATATLTVVAAPVADITLSSPPLANTPGTASVPTQEDSTYRWTLEGGTIVSGQGTPQIQYTPTGSTITRITCTVTNAAGDTALGVINVPPAIHYDPVSQPFIRGRDIGGLIPTNTGGAAVSWQISPSLSSGLAFNTTNGVISGVPTAPAALAVYTVTASNAGGISNAVALAFTVIDPAPIFSYIPDAHVFTINVPIPSISPSVTSGTATSWSISPSLPAALVFDPAGGQISGTPSALNPSTTYNVTASNVYGTSSTEGISIGVIDVPPVIHYTPSAFTLTRGASAPAIVPTNSGGPATSWTVHPSLPAGIVFDPMIGSMSGTPTALSSAATYSVTATNSGGTSAAVTLAFTVVDVIAAIQYPSPSVIVTTGSTLQPYVPTNSGGAATSWNIQPSLPSGLVFDSATGVIGGTPTAAAATQTYSVTATNTGGTSAPFTFVLSVVVPSVSSLSASSTNPLYGATVGLMPTFSAAVSASLGTTQGANDISNSPVSGTLITTAAITSAKIYWLRATNAASDFVDSSVPVTPQTVVVNAIIPAAPTRSVSTATTFSTTAAGGVSNGVTWTASSGSINAGTGVWTAPATAGNVNITATSQDDPAKTATTTVNVVSLVTASITSSSASPLYGATVDLTSTFSAAVSASVGTTKGGNEISGSPVSGTPITTTAITTSMTYWLRATNAAGDFIDSSVMVAPQTVVVDAISPSTPTRTVNTLSTFSTTARGGATGGINWTASGGSINSNTGAWTAPGTAGTIMITATSVDDASKAATTNGTVVLAATASLTASSTNPLYGATVNLTPTFSAALSAAVGTTKGDNDISSSPVSGTPITTTAITTSKTYWLRATNAAGDFIDSSVTVAPQTVVVNPITPATLTKTVNSVTPFTTTATGGVTNGVTWTASAGSITAGGVWTAPSTAAGATITATSKDDTGKSATTGVTVVAAATSSITASTAAPLYGATVYLTPTFTGAVSASVGTTQGGSDISASPTSGSAITTAVLTAPTKYWLRATNGAGDSVDSSVTVTPQTVAISAITTSDTTLTLSVGYTATAKATVTNAVDTSVNWAATDGSFSLINTASGVDTTWTAPATPGIYTLTAKSAADPSQTALPLTITVYGLPVATSLTPSTTSPLYGATVNLMPVFSNGTGSVDHGVGAVTSNNSKASAAITTATTFTLTVTNTPGQTANVSSALVTPQTVVVDVPTALQSFITTGGTQTYATTVHGALNSTVTWTASGGSMNSSTGFWTAPATAGTYTITATSVADASKSNSTTVNVVNLPVISSFIATDPLVSLDHGTMLHAVFTNGAGTARIGTNGTGSFDITNAATSGVDIPTGNLSATTTFTLTVYNEAGSSTTASLSVTVVVGSATPIGDLTGARFAHTSTLLPNGQVLIAGGSDTSALNTSQIYDPTNKTASDAGTMISARYGHTASLLANNTILLAGGNDGTTTLGTSEIWNGSFTATATLNTAREKHTATLLPSGQVLVVGGLNGTSPVVSAELYDPSTKTFTYTAGNLNTARHSHTATLLANGKVLLAGGYNGSVPLKSAELFDPSTGVFTVVGSMTTARQRHSAVLLEDGRVAVIGGQGTSAPLTSAEIFNSSGNSFTVTAGAMANARDGLTATMVASGKVIVAGGVNASGTPVDGCEILDPAAGTFGLTTLLSSARAQHSATLLQNGYILIAGGRAQSGATSAAELIDPQDGLTPTIPDAKVTAPVGASRSESGLNASVPAQTHVQNVWMITGGTITAGQGGRSITFTMPSSGTATLDVLIMSDRIVPSHSQFVVTPKPVITDFSAQKPTLTVGTSTNLIWTVEDAIWLSIDQGVGIVTGSSTAVTVESPGTIIYTLTATNAGGSVTASTSILAVPPPIAASLTAAAGTVPVGGNTTLTPIFSQGTGAISPSIGAVSSGPAYPTPAISVPTTFILTVTNTAGDTAQQSVTVGLEPVVVTAISGPTYVTAGHKAFYTATVTGSVNIAVTWQTTAGTIDGTGLTAPTGAPYDTTQTPITITATSVKGGTPANLIVQVVPLPLITSFTSSPVMANYGGSTTITPVFSMGSGQILGLGSVTSGQGVSTGPLTASKTFTLVVTNVAGDSVSQDLTVTQTTPGVTTPTPTATTVTSGTQTTFVATTTGSVNSAVTWSADGANFPGNSWTAPGQGTYTITASSVSPAGYSANTTITVVSAPVISGFTATPSTILSGSSTMLQASFSGGTALINPGGVTPTDGVAVSSGALASTITYTLTVTNAEGANVSRTVTVNVVKGVSTNPGSTMAVGRVGHTVTLLADGRVLIAGGSATATADITDTQGSNLLPTNSPMQSVRYYHTATLLADGTVLLAGGSDGSGVAQNTAELFHPATGTFTLIAGPMTQARQQHTAAIMNDGRVFLSGGMDGSGAALSSAEIYDPVTGTFSLTDTGVFRERATAARLLDGTVLIAGGDNGSVSTNSGQIFDGTGYSASTMMHERSLHTGTLMPNGNVFLAGGTDLASTLGTTELFSGASFSPSAALTTARYGHVANLLASGLVYLAGGASDSATPLSDSVIFDSSVPAAYWLTGNLTTARFQPGSTILRNGHVLVAGGSSNPAASAQTAPKLNTVEVYDPQDFLTPVLPSAAITAPTSASDNTSGLTASVPVQVTNVSYVWSLTNGTIASGLNTRSITFTHTTGVSVLSVLVISDRQIPVQSSATINPAPTIAFFTATPSTNTIGVNTILSWSATGAAGLTLKIDTGVGDVSGSTSISVTTPATSTNYTLTATDANGTATRSVTLTAVLMPTATGLTAAVNPVEKGSSTTIVPTFTTDGSASIDHGIGIVLSGVAYPTGVLNASTTTFTLSSTNTVGTSATYSTNLNIMPVVVGAIIGPTSVTVNSTSSQFSATVTGAVDKSVAWSVSAGTMDATGQLTAPATPQDILVTATSVADPSQHNQLTVHVIPVPLALSVTAATDPVLYGGWTTITTHFAQGTGVIDQGIGTVTDGVAYTTGSITANKTFTLKVTNVSGDSATFPLTIHPQPVVVSVITGPSSGKVTASHTTIFSATVSGAVDTSLTWSSAGVGVWSGATWTAPSTPGSYTITATAVNGSDNTLPIAVVAAPAISSFVATPPGVNKNQSSTLTATFSGAGSGGNSNGIVTPGNLSLASGATGVNVGPLTTSQTYTLTVTNDAGDTATAQTSVQVFLGAFSATSNGLTAARDLPTATLRPDGNVLVAGGGNGSMNVDLFDSTVLSFSVAPSLLTGRNGHTATVLPNGLILITGGWNGASTLATAELYNPTDGSFAFAGTMQQARKNHRAILLDSGKVLLLGGTAQASAEVYDPGTQTFTSTNPMASVRDSATVSRLPDGRILAAGGTNGSFRLLTAEIFDPSTNSFSTAAAMRSARHLHSATTLAGGKILIAGGSGSTGTGSAEIFDPALMRFVATGDMIQARQEHIAALLPSGMVLLAGGNTGLSSAAIDQAELFDPSTGTFIKTDFTSSVGLPSTGSAATILHSGQVLVAGGTSDGSTAVTAAELYTSTDGLTAPSADATVTASGFVPQGSTGVSAHVTDASGARYVWMVSNGTLLSGQGTSSIRFNMPSIGTATLDVLAITDRLVPSHGRALVVGEPAPVITGFTAGLNPVPYGGSTTLTPVFNNATASAMIGTGAVESFDVTASATSGVAVPVGPIKTPTQYWLTVMNRAGASANQMLTVGVQTIIVSAVTPPTPTLSVNGTRSFSATVSQAVNTTVLWSATGGSIDASGVWTASVTPGIYTITATAAADGVTSASTTATVVGLPSIQSFTALPASVNYGQVSWLTPVFTGAGADLAKIGTGIAGSSDITSSATSGGAVSTGPVLADTTYRLTVTNAAGESATETAQVTVVQPFSLTGSMSLPRLGQTTTVLPGGTVLVAGGTGGADPAELYSGETFALTTPNMKSARAHHTATLLATGQVLFAGGADGSGNAQTTAELYDPAANTFAPTAGTMVRARQDHVAALLPDGRVLIAGGYNATDKQLADAEIFDVATGMFTPVATPLTAAREFATATTLIDGRVLIAGGFNGTSPLATAEIFANGSFGAEPPIGAARSHHTATLLPSGQVLLDGGYDGSSQLASGTLFVPGPPDSFTPVGPMVQGRQDATAVLLSNGMVLLAGGTDGASELASAELFNPSNGTFTATGNMVVARANAGSGLLLDGMALVAGGTSDGTTRLASAERFDPQDGQTPFRPDSTITLSASHAYAGATGLAATAPTHSGNRYIWVIQSGIITAGQGTAAITFNMAASGDAIVDLLVISDHLVPAHGRATVTSDALPQIISFVSSADPIPYGGSTTLTAVFINASLVTLGTGGPGSSDVSASVATGVGIVAGPLSTTAYTLTLPTANGIPTSRTLTVHVQPVVISAISPSAPTVTAGHTFVFSATVSQAVNTNVLWSATGGSIDASGVWTASVTPGIYTITATAAADPTTSTSTTATVVALPTIASFTSSLGSVNFGQGVTLTPTFSAPAGSSARIGMSGLGSSEITASAASGVLVASGPLSANTTFILTVINSVGDSASATVQVTVAQYFAATGAMALARTGHTTTPLADGSVLIAGGTSAPDRAEIYSSTTGAFAFTSPMQTTRKGHSATLLADGKVLLAGGFDGTKALSSAEVFDPGSGKFTLTAGNLLHARQNHVAVLLSDGRVLIAGGSNPIDHELASADVFDPATGTFSDPGSSLQEAREFATATALPSGDVLIAGGTGSGGTVLKSAELYTVGAFSGSTFFMNVPRTHHQAILLTSGKVLIAGGSDGASALQSGELYTGGSSNSSFVAVSGSMVSARERHTATLLTNGEVLLAGGTGGISLVGIGELFNPATGTFTSVGNLISPTLDAGAALLPNGKVVIAGGTDDSSQPILGAELFDLHDGQSPDRSAPALSAPDTALFGSPQSASVALPQGARCVWWVKNGTVSLALGNNLTFLMGSSGNTTIYLLVDTNAGLPVLESKDVIGE